MATKIEIREIAITSYSLFVDGEGPFNVLEYARSRLSKLAQTGYVNEVKELILRHGGNKLSDVPVENYADFIDEVLEFYKEKTEN